MSRQRSTREMTKAQAKKRIRELAQRWQRRGDFADVYSMEGSMIRFKERISMPIELVRSGIAWEGPSHLDPETGIEDTHLHLSIFETLVDACENLLKQWEGNMEYQKCAHALGGEQEAFDILMSTRSSGGNTEELRP